MIYLDTHVIVWLYGGMKEKLSEKAAKLINEEFISISPIVELELQYLHEIGKITETHVKVITMLERDVGLTVITCNLLDLIKEASALTWTRDTFDRLITAQAILDKSNLLTKDQILLDQCDLAVWD